MYQIFLSPVRISQCHCRHKIQQHMYYHGIITPSSSGVADKGLTSTGSADFQKIWTYLGLPTISLPLLTGENNLPLGVQLVGNKLDDLRFLGTANWLEKNCKDE